MAFSLDINVDEQSDGKTFKMYDKSDWTELVGFDHTLLTYVLLTVTYDGVDYILKLVDTGDATDLLGLTADFDNLFGTGTGEGANYEASPADLLSGTTPLAETYYVDGYYTIKLDITYNAIEYEDTNYQGFLAHTTCRSTMLPLLIDMTNIDYKETRLHFMTIALLNAAEDAAEMGRATQFQEKLVTINALLDSRDLRDCW